MPDPASCGERPNTLKLRAKAPKVRQSEPRKETLMPTIHLEYRGYDLSYEQPPLMTNMFQVSVASNDKNLMAKLGLSSKIISGRGMEDAKVNARRFVDYILGT